MSVSLFFCGDISIRRGGEILSDELKKIIGECGISCCNFEGPEIDDQCHRIKKIGPCIYQRKGVVSDLVRRGFNMFCLSNNHVMDYGREGLECTLKIIEDEKAVCNGAGLSRENMIQPTLFDLCGCRVGILSLAENGFGSSAYEAETGYLWIFDKDIPAVVGELRERCDILIINCHVGAEEFEYPLPEWRDCYRSLIDMGAAVIIGHHPHVVQGYEEYHDGLIFYSLGNFAFDTPGRPDIPYNKEGMAVILKIGQKRLSGYELIPTIYENGMVSINPDREGYMHYVESLSKGLSDGLLYRKRIETFVTDKYKNMYRRYYSEGVVGKYHGVAGFLKKMRRIFIRHQNFDDFFLYHNLAIETHYWICRRASYLEMEKNRGNR